MKLADIKAALASNKKLLEENQALRARTEALEAGLEKSNTALEESIETQAALVEQVESQAAEIQELEDAATTVAEQTAEVTAAIGVAAPELPEASAEPVDEEALRAQLATEKDTLVKAAIVEQLRELRWPNARQEKEAS